MVEIWASLYDGEGDRDLGAHRFVACPRVGETVVLWVDGQMTVIEVFSVSHSSRPVAGRGPTGEPNIIIRGKPGRR